MNLFYILTSKITFITKRTMYNGHRSLKSTKELKLMSKVSNNFIESGRELLRENPHARDHSNKKQLNQSNNYQLQISSILGEALLMHALIGLEYGVLQIVAHL